MELLIFAFFLQFVAVILAITGIVLFAYEDGFKYNHSTCSLIGVALSVGSAIGAALYKVGIVIPKLLAKL